MDRISTIELALANEETERSFYLRQAQRSRNSLAQGMFRRLAEEEAEHKARVGELHRKLLADGSWPSDVPLRVSGTGVRELLRDLVRGDDAAGHDGDDIQALERAVAFEAEASRRYAALAEASENRVERDFFSFLSQIEREHQLSLTDSLAFLRDPEGWMMQHERAGLDGA
jgi:rubrerythrin